MSGGIQHRAWSSKPKNRALMGKVRRARFHHTFAFSDFGLTYQACRFCATWARISEDQDHGGACPIAERHNEACFGLWKYGVRHYICSACRTNVLLELPPNKRKDG